MLQKPAYTHRNRVRGSNSKGRTTCAELSKDQEGEPLRQAEMIVANNQITSRMGKIGPKRTKTPIIAAALKKGEVPGTLINRKLSAINRV